MTDLSEFWSDVQIAGHRCRAFDPRLPSPHGDTVLYLHDEAADGVAAWSAFSQLLEQYGLRCIAPLTGRSWWTDRIWPAFDAELSTERFVLERLLAWLSEQWDVRPSQVALLGVGMGGQGALKLSYKHPNVFPICAAIAPSIDYHHALEAGDPTLNSLYRDAEQARQDTATLHIHPLNWPRHQWFCSDPADYMSHDGADRLRMKLYSLGVPYEADLEASADGDYGRYAERMLEPALAFIVERLERERLRA